MAHNTQAVSGEMDFREQEQSGLWKDKMWCKLVQTKGKWIFQTWIKIHYFFNTLQNLLYFNEPNLRVILINSVQQHKKGVLAELEPNIYFLHVSMENLIPSIDLKLNIL